MIDITRLQSRMEKVAAIGSDEKGGTTRLALTAEDKQARELLIAWMKEIHLTVRVDDFGNIYGRNEGANPDLAPVILGSHVDTVPHGGKFDGLLGVLGALEALETFIETQGTPERSIEIISFTNEEGARFMPQMLGSGAVTGKFTRDYAYNRTDKDGIRFEDELRKIDFLGDKENRLQDVHSYVELHIEQGPVLEMENLSIGVVEGIAGFSWLEVTLKGESNHSGTTPMNKRQDSLVAATALIQQLNKWASSKTDGTVLTVGKISVNPGTMNVIPAETTFTIDVRVHDDENFKPYLNEVKQMVEQTSTEYGMSYELDEIRTQPPVPFSEKLIDLVEDVTINHQLSYRRMKSGAGHDAMYMQDTADTVMIFVPSVHGISHSPEEYTPWDEIEKGVNVLYGTMKELAK